MGILSRSMDAEAGKWTGPIRLATGDDVQNIFKNPTGKPIFIDRIVVHVITGVSAKTIDIGTASDATTTSDNLIDGASVATSGSAVDNMVNNGTNGKQLQYLAAGGFVNADLSAASTGLVAYAYIHYKKLTSA